MKRKRPAPMVTMSLTDALDYSSGRVLTALKQPTLSAEERDAILLADWPDTTIRIRSAVQRLPGMADSALYTSEVIWKESKSTQAYVEDLRCAIASGMAAVKRLQDHVRRLGTDSEAWDRLRGALEDAVVSLQDLVSAM